VAAKVHDKVEVPEPPVTVVGLSVHATLSLVKATLPVKPPKGEIVIVDVAAIPTVAGTTVGLADMLKSGGPATLTAMELVELVMALLVPPAPVIVAVKRVSDPTVAENEQLVVAVPPAVNVTDEGLHATLRPDGEEVKAVATAPANWKGDRPRLATVTVTLLLPPLLKETLEELETILKPPIRIKSVPPVTTGRPVADIVFL